MTNNKQKETKHMKKSKFNFLAAASLCTVALCSPALMACGKSTPSSKPEKGEQGEIIQNEKIIVNISNSDDLNNYLLSPDENYNNCIVKLASDIDYNYNEIVSPIENKSLEIDFQSYKIKNAIIFAENSQLYDLFNNEEQEIFDNCFIGETLTQEQLNGYTFNVNNKAYYLSGDFDNLNVKTSVGLNLIFDGKNATFTGHTKFDFGDNYSLTNISFDKDNQLVEREGCYIVRNIKSKTNGEQTELSNLSVGGTNTELHIFNNTVAAIDVMGNNTKYVIDGNQIDAQLCQTLSRLDGINVKYGIFVFGFAYDLSFTNNLIENAYGHSFAISGYITQDHNGVYENIISAFSGNTITVASGASTKRATVKIWDDKTFTPDAKSLNDNAKTLINTILANNNLSKNRDDAYLFSFYNVDCDDVVEE